MLACNGGFADTGEPREEDEAEEAEEREDEEEEREEEEGEEEEEKDAQGMGTLPRERLDCEEHEEMLVWVEEQEEHAGGDPRALARGTLGACTHVGGDNKNVFFLEICVFCVVTCIEIECRAFHRREMCVRVIHWEDGHVQGM